LKYQFLENSPLLAVLDTLVSPKIIGLVEKAQHKLATH